MMTSVADRLRPGELMCLAADGMTAQGLAVHAAGGEDSRRLLIACPHARCALSLSDCGLAEFECCPASGPGTDPKRVADLATALLTGQAGDFPRRGAGYGRPDLTLKGKAGLELKARGLHVELEVYEDPQNLDARSLIVVTNPAATYPATVQVCDDGCVTWACDYWDDPATPAWEPDGRTLAPGPAEVAAAVVATVTTAMSVMSGTGCPAAPGRARDGQRPGVSRPAGDPAVQTMRVSPLLM